MTSPKIKIPKIKIQRLPHAHDLPLPAYESAGAAGMDLRAACPEDEPITLPMRMSVMIPTGFAIAVPQGFEAQVRPRSGLAANHAISVANTPGTIDSDYRGEVKVLLINHGSAPYSTIKRGDRIAQLVIAPVVQATLIETDSLDTTERGAGGFGSTGKK